MEETGRAKWAIWMLLMLLSLSSVIVIAQPGFLSISCGAKRNHTDESNITWVTDDNYIQVGERADIGDASQQAYGSYLHTLRFFPKPLNKSCYQLPVTPNVPYLLRLWFAIGNYSGFQKFPDFNYSVETPGMLFNEGVAAKTKGTLGSELIFVSSGRMLYICLTRTSESDDPFISAIELRTLQKGMYSQAKPGTALWILARRDLGGNSLLRYPLDNFDRVWHVDIDNSSPVRNVSSHESISSNNTKDLAPNAVIQTAWVMNVDSFPFTLGTSYGQKTLLLLYFAEIEKLNISETRSFYVTIHGERRSDIITLLPNHPTVELTIHLEESDETDDLKFYLVKATNSISRPIINAYEHYLLIDTERETYSPDIEAIDAIKSRFGIKEWISDPCFLLPWNGISCDDGSLDIRISEINLSRKNLEGSIPTNIGQLTALINVTLDSNHLIGNLPNFSRLIMLERLHLQNNHLSGSVPDWLSELKNLKELFIENNNFSGVIPAQLLNKPSLKFKYSGNNYLCTRMHKGKCIKEVQEIRNNPRKGKVSVIIGVTISAGLTISVALVVAIAVYRKKLRTKKRLSEGNPITMPDRTISRAFTLQEMIEATQNFSRKIGQGGFGSVYFGKLPDGKDIAVKVLSSFTRQGVYQFQNEADLLSRVHHKKLVSLLGYCNESRELMLIYEHMSGGSLQDRLYGKNLEDCYLNWKARLKIAFHAAQGLEYLHVGCTPKIIHRDVKSANILMDSNLNGKLADFGLSKLTIEGEGEVTHVTTMVKGTPGYLDPEYFRTHQLTEKSDVYSFGVVLLEIVCGRPPIIANLSDEELNLIQWVTSYMERNENPGEIEEIVDKRLGGSYDMKSMICIVEVALQCVEPKPAYRPTTSEVVKKIREAIVHENENGNSSPLPNSERIGAEYGDSCGQTSGAKDMEWADNSSNLPCVGR